MKAKVLKFGEIEVDGERYDHDIVIDTGKVKKRKKRVSKPFHVEYGHTPVIENCSAPADSQLFSRAQPSDFMAASRGKLRAHRG
jgi:hypothetical protein